MLDQNMMNSVLSSGGVARTEPKAKEEGGDAEAFNAALNDASATPKSKKSDKEEAKAEAKDSKDKKREAKEHEDTKLAQQQPVDRTGAIHMKKLMAKNVDTMSLAEKQALRLAEFASMDQQNVKSQPQLAQQPVAQPQAQASKAGKTAKAPGEMIAGKGASVKVSGEAERADEKTLQAVEELQKKDQGKSSSSSNLDQLLVKEASFADELRKTSSADKARERQSVIDQILQQIEVRNFANRTELHLKLNPEYLGELKVKLVHTDDGIRADFETSSKATRQILREGEEELKAQAKDKGVRFKAMRVTLVENVDAPGAKG